MTTGNIIIYESADGVINLDVRLEGGSVWLTQEQIALLFGTLRPAVTKHLHNIYKSGELAEAGTCSILEHKGNNGRQTYPVKYYNLDAILSVGYRVNSRNATQFRIWANRTLKEYLIRGYVVNNNAQREQLDNLKQAIQLLSSVVCAQTLTANEGTGSPNVIADYAYALDTLDRYDYQSLQIDKTTAPAAFRATYQDAVKAIADLRIRFGGGRWFGNEKDKSFQSSINVIYQTFDGNELYPSVEEKAAMLLYLVVKNHSFTDGNKRIAAFLFLWFLGGSGVLYKPDGRRLIENNALVALTLMIAQSRTEDKDMMIKVIVNLINQNN